MRGTGIDFNKSFEQQHPVICNNVIAKVLPAFVPANHSQIQAQHYQLAKDDCFRLLRSLVADVIRGKTRSQFRQQRMANPDAPVRKRGRPRKANPIRKRTHRPRVF